MVLMGLSVSACHIHIATTGGASGPLVDFLAHLGRAFGENATIGSEMMTALVEISLSKTDLYIMLRNAILLTNVCIGKIQDGVAKCVTKTDFAGLRSAKNQTLIKDMESFLHGSWEKCKQAIAGNQVDKSAAYKVLGYACIRCVLLLFKKEKLGKEGKKYTFEEIKDIFEDDLKRGGVPKMESKDVENKSLQEAFSLDEGKNSMFLAKKQLGLEPNSCYMLKDSPNRVWVLESVHPDHVVLVYRPLLDPKKKVTIKINADEIADKMKATKSKPAELFTDSVLSNLLPTLDCEHTKRAKCYLALVEVYNNHDLAVAQVHVQKSPKLAIFAKKDFKPKQIKLIPCPEGPASLVLKKPSGKSSSCKFGGTTFWILFNKPLKFPKPEDPNQNDIQGVLTPYFICYQKDVDGCLEEKNQTLKSNHGDIQVQMLTNPDAVSAHQQLCVKEQPQQVEQEHGEPVKKRARQS